MTGHDSFELYKRGREAWNDWAKEKLAEKDQLIQKGMWLVAEHSNHRLAGQNPETEEWLRTAKAEFATQKLMEANFSGFVFPGEVNFEQTSLLNADFSNAVFYELACFNNSIFGDSSSSGPVLFDGVSFTKRVEFEHIQCGSFSAKNAKFTEASWQGSTLGEVHFSEVIVSDSASFESIWASKAHFSRVAFEGDVFFDKATFVGKTEFIESRFGGHVSFENSSFESSTRFEAIQFCERANFFASTFKACVNFDAPEFMAGAVFSRTQFDGEAVFNKPSFSSDGLFINVVFNKEALFLDAIFKRDALFNGSTFHKDVNFDYTRFEGNAIFDKVVFREFAYFISAYFKDDATFIAVKGDSFFTLKGAVFESVPDFRQAHFAEAPQLDDATFYSDRAAAITDEFTVRWRALKRLAIQSHDHPRELNFFAEEIKSMRNVEHRRLPNWSNFSKDIPLWPGGSKYWMGMLYEVLSDFGRSILRPLGWLMVVMVFFSVFYFLCHLHFSPFDVEPSRAVDCDPVFGAIYLAMQNGLLFSGLGRLSKLEKTYACLYGGNPSDPTMPDLVVFFGMLQTLFSAALIFLLLLAIRNHFRIK